MARVLVAITLLAALAAPAAHASPQPLRDYMLRIGPAIDSYRAISVSLDRLLSEPPVTNVDPLVDKLYRIADRFDRLGARWVVIGAPKGLKVRHRAMGRAFDILARGWRVYAAGLFTRHLEDLQAASEQLRAMLGSASYLQHRWAAALQGALIRAGLRVPKWLHGMASSPP